MAIALKVWHWTCAGLTVPFGVLAFLFPNPERVKFVSKDLAFPAPMWFVGICSGMVHLTIVSHEMIALQFVFALLRDHGFVSAPGQNNEINDFGSFAWGAVEIVDLLNATATGVGLFVAVVFWGAIASDPLLLVDARQMDKLFPIAEARKSLFAVLFGPIDTSSDWQRGFHWFMRYIHTVCPLLLIIDCVIVPRRVYSFELELATAFVWVVGYIAWNMFCWWLLRTPGYPFQKMVYETGIANAVATYITAVVLGLSLVAYCRLVRGVEGAMISGVTGALTVAGVLWLTIGLPPFKAALARRNGWGQGIAAAPTGNESTLHSTHHD